MRIYKYNFFLKKTILLFSIITFSCNSINQKNVINNNLLKNNLEYSFKDLTRHNIKRLNESSAFINNTESFLFNFSSYFSYLSQKYLDWMNLNNKKSNEKILVIGATNEEKNRIKKSFPEDTVIECLDSRTDIKADLNKNFNDRDFNLYEHEKKYDAIIFDSSVTKFIKEYSNVFKVLKTALKDDGVLYVANSYMGFFSDKNINKIQDLKNNCWISSQVIPEYINVLPLLD